MTLMKTRCWTRQPPAAPAVTQARAARVQELAAGSGVCLWLVWAEQSDLQGFKRQQFRDGSGLAVCIVTNNLICPHTCRAQMMTMTACEMQRTKVRRRTAYAGGRQLVVGRFGGASSAATGPVTVLAAAN